MTVQVQGSTIPKSCTLVQAIRDFFNISFSDIMKEHKALTEKDKTDLRFEFTKIGYQIKDNPLVLLSSKEEKEISPEIGYSVGEEHPAAKAV